MNFSLAAARAGFSAGFMGGRDVAASGSADCGIGVPSVTVTSLAWLVLSAGAGLTTGGITEEEGETRSVTGADFAGRSLYPTKKPTAKNTKLAPLTWPPRAGA